MYEHQHQKLISLCVKWLTNHLCLPPFQYSQSDIVSPRQLEYCWWHSGCFCWGTRALYTLPRKEGKSKLIRNRGESACISCIEHAHSHSAPLAAVEATTEDDLGRRSFTGQVIHLVGSFKLWSEFAFGLSR